ncbi:MAG: hypothetical protein GY832_23540 [Chloroflexi bacterium]|nr:hypothetical protein [Chloroflexota bacterium]
MGVQYLPERVKVGPLTFPVETGNEFNAAGRCKYHPRLVIQVDTDFDTQYQVQTLIHEIQHAILDTTGDEKMNEDEGFVHRVACAWMTVLLESPKLLECLMAQRDAFAKTTKEQ